MENTGRIHKTLDTKIREILWGKSGDVDINTEMGIGVDVDRAHLVMLYEEGLIDRDSIQKLLSLMEESRRNNFQVIKGQYAQRGIYLLYEDYLIQTLGMQAAGNLQLGRSRNDRNATICKIRVRGFYINLINELINLQIVLKDSADKYSNNIMPIYTHYQPALPVTLGHYLAAISLAISRVISDLLAIHEEIDESPLGAGAIGGTSININPARTAELLGFSKPCINSIHSIASRDYTLRILSCISILGTTLSRYACDLLLWSTSELNMITFPDELVGSSSMMPQKRNAFILEHIQGRCSRMLGVLVSAVSAQHSTPFSNSIAVNTESISGIWMLFEESIDTITLVRLITEGIKPNCSQMLQLANNGFTFATAIADRLTLKENIPFRESHRITGSLINEILNIGGEKKDLLLRKRLSHDYPNIQWDKVEPKDIVNESNYGGGPGPKSMKLCLETLNSILNKQLNALRDYEKICVLYPSKLNSIVSELII